jgi:hypothetical protein
MLADTNAPALAGLGGLILVTVLVFAYFFPTIVAAVRKVPNVGSVVVINLLLGWTLIGWAVALAMAARSTPPASLVANFTTVAAQTGVPAGWHPDPSGRHQLRAWDGQRWTEHVFDNGMGSVDPL